MKYIKAPPPAPGDLDYCPFCGGDLYLIYCVVLLFIVFGAHDWLFFYDTGLFDVLVSVADLEDVKGVRLKPPPSPPTFLNIL